MSKTKFLKKKKIFIDNFDYDTDGKLIVSKTTKIKSK